jgi:hypothetical protein
MAQVIIFMTYAATAYLFHSSTVIDSRTKRTHEGKMRKTLFFSKSNR